MKFAEWISAFVSEKHIDVDATFEFNDKNGFNVMPYGFVIEATKSASPAEQAKIKATLQKIDFLNGDPCHFLRHLGQGLAAASL